MAFSSLSWSGLVPAPHPVHERTGPESTPRRKKSSVEVGSERLGELARWWGRAPGGPVDDESDVSDVGRSVPAMSATAPIEHPGMTAEELFELPDDGLRHELVEGELRTMAPAGAEHGRVALADRRPDPRARR